MSGPVRLARSLLLLILAQDALISANAQSSSNADNAFKCFEKNARTFQRQHESGVKIMSELHRAYIGNRHFEVVEIVALTQAEQLMESANRLLESLYMSLMQVMCPLRVFPLFADSRIKFHIRHFHAQIRYVLDGKIDIQESSDRLMQMTQNLDTLVDGIATVNFGNSMYEHQIPTLLIIHREIIANALHFLEPILSDLNDVFSVPNFLPMEMIPRFEHQLFTEEFPSFASVFRISPLQKEALPGDNIALPDFQHNLVRNVMSMSLEGLLQGPENFKYIWGTDPKTLPGFTLKDNMSTMENERNAVFSQEFLDNLANPNRAYLSSGNQFHRVCRYVRGQGKDESYGGFLQFDLEDYFEDPAEPLKKTAKILDFAAAPSVGGVPLSMKTNLGQNQQAIERQIITDSHNIYKHSGQPEMFVNVLSRYRRQKGAKSDPTGFSRQQRSVMQILRKIDQKYPLSYFVMSYTAEEPTTRWHGQHYETGETGESGLKEQQEHRNSNGLFKSSCRGELLEYNGAECLPTEAGWGHYRFHIGIDDPFNVTITYQGRTLGPGARLADGLIHSTNTMSRLAQWSSMISIYKSVNHYSPDYLFVHPLVGNCILVRNLLQSGPVKPKVVQIAINPAIPPPLEVAPDHKQYLDLMDHGVHKHWKDDSPSIIWRLQCSLAYVEEKIMKKHGYVLDHVESVFAVYVYKKMLPHDDHVTRVAVAYDNWSTQEGRRDVNVSEVTPKILRAAQYSPTERMLNAVEAVEKRKADAAQEGDSGKQITATAEKPKLSRTALGLWDKTVRDQEDAELQMEKRREEVEKAKKINSGDHEVPVKLSTKLNPNPALDTPFPFSAAINPPQLHPAEHVLEDACLTAWRPTNLELQWLTGWHCSPVARVIADIEFDMSFDPHPLVYCFAGISERADAMCSLYNHYIRHKIPITEHNIECPFASKIVEDSLADRNKEQAKSGATGTILPEIMSLGLPTQVGNDEFNYKIKRSPENWIDRVKPLRDFSTVFRSYSDFEILKQIEDQRMSVMQAYASRVLHEKPLMKFFIEKDGRGRCVESECECFPPFRGVMCELEDRGTNVNATKINAVLHFTMPDSAQDLHDVQRALRSVWEKYNHKYDYPVVIFHEGMSENSRRIIVLASPHRVWFSNLGRKFASIESVPEIWREPLQKQNMPFSLGYRAMCRWRSGPVFLEPALAQFDYGMTLDTDSYLPGNWIEDPFEMLERTKKVAAFPHLGREAASVVLNFLFYYLLYCKMHNLNPRRSEILASLVEKNWKWYQQTFMSDIEILYLPWFRDPKGEYQKFFNYMDSTGGFWMYRWGNNPFRTFAMGTFLNDEQVSIATLPYLHQEFCTCGAESQCRKTGPDVYDRVCQDKDIRQEDSESLHAKLYNLQPWRGLDWQVDRFEKEDFHNFVIEQSGEF